MTCQLQLPQSLADYLNNKGVATAVDQLLLQKNDYLPSDLGWDEVIDYYDALLMAAKVRRDYLETLMEISKNIWQLDECWKEFSIDKLEPSEQPSPDVVWNDSFYRVFELGNNSGKRLYTAVVINPGQGVIAYMKLGGIEITQDLSPLWSKEDEYGYRSTKKNLAVPGNTSIIDLRKLKEATNEVLAAIANNGEAAST